MNPLLENKTGCYVTSDRMTWTSKKEALLHATTNKVEVGFYFYNHVWEKYDLSTLGRRSLPDLYRERALTLRNKYDRLVLHYSGGSDSHNILMTFINNGIPLDEVVVKWCTRLNDLGVYVPNATDKSARNALSEWDFTIKPTLDWLAASHPEIKITVIDFLDDEARSYSDADKIANRIEKIGLSRNALGSFTMRSGRTVDETLLSAASTQRTAQIFGVEKPILVVIDGKIYFCFSDGGFETTVLEHEDLSSSIEPFYWTVEPKELPIEQAYAVAQYMKMDFEAKKAASDITSSDHEKMMAASNLQSEKSKSILYKDTWDTRKFQVGKPNSMRSDWWWWLYELPQFSHLRNGFSIATENLAHGIDQKHFVRDSLSVSLKVIPTRLFYLMDL